MAKYHLICDACARLVDKCESCGGKFREGDDVLCDYNWPQGIVLVHHCSGCAGGVGTNAVVEREED